MTAGRGGWVVSPAFDLLFLANVGWVLLLWPGLARADRTLATEFWQLYFLTAPGASLVRPEELNARAAAQQEPFPAAHPAGWLPLYTMVTFRPDISYATVRRKARRQGDILGYATWAAAAVTVGTLGITCAQLWRRFRGSPSAA